MEQRPSRKAIVRLADFIVAQKDEIIQRWSRAVYEENEIKSSDNLTYRQLIDYMPKLFEEICCLLKLDCSEKIKEEVRREARIHGHHRWQQGYDLSELLREFGILRIILLEYAADFARKNPDLTPDIEVEGGKIIHKFLNDASITSAQQFAEEQELEARRYQAELEAANRCLEDTNRELKQTNDRLSDMYKLRLLFTRTASHELRNVLSAISGATLMLGKDIDEAVRQEMLAILRRNIADMETLLDQLLDYSRLMDRQERPKTEAFDLPRLLDELITTFEPMAKSKGLNLEGEIDPTLEPIVSDRLKVKQIVSNLLSNAIKYTASGRVELSARILDPEHYVIIIEDTGAGIEPESLARIFDEFERAASSAGVRGTGLGLTITKRLVELLGGSISVDSKVGQGSRFEVVLPKLCNFGLTTADNSKSTTESTENTERFL